jgi:hypothetical protein
MGTKRCVGINWTQANTTGHTLYLAATCYETDSNDSGDQQNKEPSVSYCTVRPHGVYL